MASILRRGDSYSVRFKCRQCKEKHGFPAGVQKCAEPQKMENPTRNLAILRGIFVRSRELESLAL